jgi:hypothetical protein
VCLIVGNRTVFNAFRDDKQFAGAKMNAALSHLNGYPTLQDEKKVIGVLVSVPGKRSLDLNDHQVMPIELPDGTRLEMVRGTWPISLRGLLRA